MTKKASLTDVATGYTSQATLNDNFEALNDAFDNTLSLDGSTPNQMGADLDLNGFDLLNADNISLTGSLSVSGVNLVPNDAAAVPNWEGTWLTATDYVLNDLVRDSGSTYICLVAHTSGTFSTDLSAAKWELFAQQGAAGAGTGDMLAANNLSDVATPATALANIGGQPLNSSLTSISGVTVSTQGLAILDDTSYSAMRTTMGLGSSATRNLIDDDTMATATSTNIPSAESVVAFAGPAYEGTPVSLPAPGVAATFAHGLGAVPRRYQVVLRFTSAVGGYANGDEVILTGVPYSTYGWSIFADATNVRFRPGSAGPQIVDDVVGGAILDLRSHADVEVFVRAWA